MAVVVEPLQTVVDQELPPEVRAHQALSAAMTQLREAPRVPTLAPGGIAAPNPAGATLIRERSGLSDAQALPVEERGDLPARSTLARNIVVGALVVALVVVAITVALSGH